HPFYVLDDVSEVDVGSTARHPEDAPPRLALGHRLKGEGLFRIEHRHQRMSRARVAQIAE
ncbi:MAG: hypothetical protein ACRDYZ_07400, partial [Acidimicrobiales bacterium]